MGKHNPWPEQYCASPSTDDEMNAATTAIVRDLTRSDLAVYLAATGRFDRDVSSLAKGCQAEKKKRVPRRLANTKKETNAAAARTSACGPCPARATGAPRLRVEVRDFESLPRRLVLVKVPETGSSTAANLLASLAAKRNATCYLPGAAECGADASAADWQLAHDAPGTKFALHVTTAREPMARAVSKAMKACEVGVCDYKKKKKKACKEKACSCAGATLADRSVGPRVGHVAAQVRDLDALGGDVRARIFSAEARDDAARRG